MTSSQFQTAVDAAAGDQALLGDLLDYLEIHQLDYDLDQWRSLSIYLRADIARWIHQVDAQVIQYAFDLAKLMAKDTPRPY